MSRVIILSFCFWAFTVNGQGSLDDMNLEDLMEMRVSNVASLIPTAPKKLPVSSTIISHKMIKESGARNMMELLEIFVPSYQWQNFSQSGGLDGFRGLASRRKYLILVNGKVMTAPRISTNFAERLTSLMGDIESIEVIRGPGSAILGPGAISGIISIKTFSSKTFSDKTDFTVRSGFIEDFRSFEFKIGRKFFENGGVFFYGGIDDYRGASGNDADYYSARNFNGVGLSSGVAFDNADHYKASYRKQPRYKFHLQLDLGNLSTWMRYTRSGMQGVNNGTTVNLLGQPETHETGSQQLSFMAVYNYELSKFLKSKFTLNYTMDELLLRLPSFTAGREFLRSSRMDWYQGKAEIFWDPDPHHAFAAGIEFSKYVSGLKSTWANEAPSVSGFVPADKWYSHAGALFGEYRYQFSESTTFFLGARLDEHSDTEPIFSPKVGATFLLTDKDTIKLVYSRSVRRPAENELRRVQRINGEAQEEELDSYEIIYQRDINKNNKLILSMYYYKTGLESLTNTYQSQKVGDLEVAGAELAWEYESKKWLVRASHSYTDLLNLKLDDPSTNFTLSPEPYGGRSDFVSWAPHQTKVFAKYNINEKLSANASAVIYWGFPGAKSAAEGLSSPIITTNGGNETFQENIYIHLGATYKLNDKITLRGHAMNVLGWISDRYNKRNVAGMETYVEEAPAFILSLEYKF